MPRAAASGGRASRSFRGGGVASLLR